MDISGVYAQKDHMVLSRKLVKLKRKQLMHGLVKVDLPSLMNKDKLNSMVTSLMEKSDVLVLRMRTILLLQRAGELFRCLEMY